MNLCTHWFKPLKLHIKYKIYFVLWTTFWHWIEHHLCVSLLLHNTKAYWIYFSIALTFSLPIQLLRKRIRCASRNLSKNIILPITFSCHIPSKKKKREMVLAARWISNIVLSLLHFTPSYSIYTRTNAGHQPTWEIRRTRFQP